VRPDLGSLRDIHPGHQWWPLFIASSLLFGVLAAVTFGPLAPSTLLWLILVPVGLRIATKWAGAVLAAFLMIPFYKGVLNPYLPLDLTPLLAVLTVFLTLLSLAQNEKSPLQRSNLLPFLLWTAILGLLILASMFSPDNEFASLKIVEFLLLAYLPLLLSLKVATNRRLIDQYLLSVLSLSGLVISFSVLQLLLAGTSDRIAVLGSNTIATGQAAAIGPLLGVSMLPIFPMRLKVLIIAATPLAVFVAVASGSRGPIFVGAATAVILILVRSRHTVRDLILLTIGAIGITGILVSSSVRSLLPEMSLWRIQVFLDALLSWDWSAVDTSTAARLRLFQHAIDLFESRPILGYGAGGFEWSMDRIVGLEIYFSPHNLYLQIASDVGIVGILLLLLFFGLTLFNGWRYRHDPRGVAALSLSLFVLIYGFVDLDFYTSRYAWGFLLIMLAYRSDDSTPGIFRRSGGI
jgi:O-antigen ligase